MKCALILIPLAMILLVLPERESRRKLLVVLCDAVADGLVALARFIRVWGRVTAEYPEVLRERYKQAVGDARK